MVPPTTWVGRRVCHNSWPLSASSARKQNASSTGAAPQGPHRTLRFCRNRLASNLLHRHVECKPAIVAIHPCQIVSSCSKNRVASLPFVYSGGAHGSSGSEDVEYIA